MFTCVLEKKKEKLFLCQVENDRISRAETPSCFYISNRVGK